MQLSESHKKHLKNAGHRYMKIPEVELQSIVYQLRKHFEILG